MNIIDSAIAFISPETALKRARHRLALEHYRDYEGAGKNRRTDGWKSSGSSSNTETRKALATLQDRSREQDRNNSYARKAINVIATNTVGAGIRLSISEKTAGRDVLLKAWNDWADYKNCDFDEHHNFYGLQKLVMRTVALSGNALIIRQRTKFNKGSVPLQIQVLESDYLDATKDSGQVEGGGRILHGVEFDDKGKRKGYWIYNHHPGEIAGTKNFTSKFIPAKDVIHVYLKDRPGQEMGVPFGSSSMILLKDLKDYQDAQLLKQKISACLAVFVKKDNPNQDDFDSSEGEITERLEPGTIQYLSPGEEVQFADPPSTEGYADHTKKLLQGVAAGYGITYEAMTGDMSNVNFSSGRMGWLEFHRQIQDWQLNMMIPIFCDGVFEWWKEAAKILGIPVGEVKQQWTAPRREMIDPSKEITAIIKAVRAGLMSLSEALREMGYDPDNVLNELAANMALLDKLGLKLDVDVRNDIVAKPEPGAATEKKTNKKATK